jgi:hypothetical protein
MKEGVVYRDARGVGYMLTKCIICGERRPVSLLHGKPLFDRCKPCAMNTVETKARISKAKKGVTYGQRISRIDKKFNLVDVLSRPTNKVDGLFDSIRIDDMLPGVVYRDNDRIEYLVVQCELCGKRRAVRRHSGLLKTRCHRCAMAMPETRMHLSQAHMGHTTSEIPTIEAARRAKISEVSKRYWANADFRQKTVAASAKGHRQRPTKPEIVLDTLLQEHYPDQWLYNGDCSQGVVIGGLIPDFVGINDERKRVIELFGIHFHSHTKYNSYIRLPYSRTEEGRVVKFKECGFDCLVIWDTEMKHPDTVLAKIKEFNA